MSFKYHHRQSILHDQQHNQRRDLTQDLSCPDCYPPESVPDTFKTFWEYLKRLVPPTLYYSNNTVQSFINVERTRQTLARIGKTTSSTANILPQYKRILLLIRYNTIPEPTAADVAYQIANIALLTLGFTEPLPKGTAQKINEYKIPVETDDPLYRAYKQLQDAWKEGKSDKRNQPAEGEPGSATFILSPPPPSPIREKPLIDLSDISIPASEQNSLHSSQNLNWNTIRIPTPDRSYWKLYTQTGPTPNFDRRNSFPREFGSINSQDSLKVSTPRVSSPNNSRAGSDAWGVESNSGNQ